MITVTSSEILWGHQLPRGVQIISRCGIISSSDPKVIPVTSIISKIEGTLNTAVGKIKQNADGHSFDKEGTEQEELGKNQLSDSSEKNNIEKDD